ncbi:DEAD/DEAH box helicase [Hyphomicrobiales bacterium]|nr:DEAD/DEAH box helicase [Hyphomicrobiales bacterium]
MIDTNMNVDTPHLHIDFMHPNTVVFYRNKLVSDTDWRVLIRWWNEDNHYQSVSDSFLLPFDIFAKKASWLRINWKEIGTFNFSQALKDELGKQTQIHKDFEKAKNHRRNLPNIDWAMLKLKRVPTDEQKNNIKSMVSIPNGANFSVPGAGKTMTTLATWKFLRNEGSIDKLFIVCPKSAFAAWVDEEPKETFIENVITQVFVGEAINPSTEILITNYEKLENKKYLERISNWVFRQSTMLVLDEAHRVKGGGDSTRWQACKKIADISSRIDLLTGTPMPQDYSDLRNLLLLSWRNLPKPELSDANIRGFQRGGLFVRTTKEELKLPKLEITEIPIEQGENQRQIYSALKKSYAGSFSLSMDQEAHFRKRGRAVMSLIGASTNPGLLAGKKNEGAFLNLNWPPEELENNLSLMDAVEKYVSIETPPKYLWLINFVHEASKKQEKVLIWSSLVGNLKAVERLLKKYNPAMVFGGTSEDDRKNAIIKFKNDESCKVLITNPQTLGEGISLHKVCHQAVYIDRTYNAGQYLQSLDRIHRLGLPKDIITKVYILRTKNTIDQTISVRLETKVSRMASVLNDFGLVRDSLPNMDEDDIFDSNSIDEDDIKKLMEHLKSND